MSIIGPTSYQHQFPNYQLNDVHQAMDYNAAGQPILRTSGDTFSWAINISAGNVDGVSYIEKFGMNIDVDGNKETIWDGGGIYTYIETAETVTVTSSSGQDNPTGTGARNVVIQGLNQAGAVVEETVNLGSTSVAAFRRVFRVAVFSAGTSGVNEGTVSITSDDTSTVLAIIGIDGVGITASGRGQTFMALYTIPAGKTGYVTQWTVGAGKQNTDAVAMFMTRDPDAVGNGSWNARDIITVSATTYTKNYTIPFKVNELDDIEIRAYSTTNNSLVSSTFNLILYDNLS